jgi:hypothetical protein
VGRHQLTFPQLGDTDGELYAHFGIAAQPAFVIIDPNGDVTTILGGLDETKLTAALDEATENEP